MTGSGPTPPAAVESRRRWVRLGTAVAVGAAALAGIYYYLFFLRSPERPSVLFAHGDKILNLQLVVADEPDNPKWKLKLANAYLVDGHYLSAVAVLKAALRQGADEEAARRLLGTAYRNLAQYQLAIPEARRVQELSPHTLGPRLALAHLYLDLGQKDKARQVLDSIPTDEQGRPLIGKQPPAERAEKYRSDQMQIKMLEMTDPAAMEDDPAMQREALALAYGEAEDWERSLWLAERSVKYEPARFGGYVSAGQALMALGRAGEAVRFFKPVPVNGSFRYLTALALRARNRPGDADAAEAELQEAVRLDPTLGRAWWDLAQIHQRRDEWLEAAEGYAKANQYGVERPRTLKLAVEASRKAGRADFAEQLLGAYYQQSGQPKKALQFYRRRLQEHPDAELAYRQVAGALRALGRDSERLETLTTAHQKFPQAAAVTVALAQAYADANDSQASLVLLRKATAGSDQPDPQVLSALAAAANGAGRFTEAEQAYRRLIERQGSGIAPRMALARLLMEQRQDPGKLQEAIQLLEGAVPEARLSASLFRQLGLAYSYAGRQQEAIWSLRHAIDLEPGQGESYQSLGDLDRKVGNDEEAKWMYDLAKRYRQFLRQMEVLKGRARRQPPDVEAIRRLAEFYFAARSPMEALAEYQRLLSISPKDAPARRRLATLYGQLGRKVDQAEMLTANRP